MACEQSTAIIAASAALAGVLISLLGNWLLSCIKQRHEHKALLRSKYEELAFLVVDSVGDYQNILVAEFNHQLLRDSQPISAQKVSALAQLYFPELVAATDDYLVALVSFQNACARAAVANKSIAQVEAISSSPKVEQAQLVLEKVKNTLDSQIQTYAKTYTIP